MSLHRVIERESAGRAGANGPDRREALRLLSLGAAAALAGCRPPKDQIVPQRGMPANASPAAPQRYATALELAGYARGATGVVVDGRPVKIDGLAHHPASLGATDVFMEAAVLDLFDPQRSMAPAHGRTPVDWRAVDAALLEATARTGSHGAGLAVLTGRILSPTVLRALDALRARRPELRHVRWEPVDDDAAREGARLAFGRAVTALPRLQDADVIVALDDDPLGPGPDQIRLARAFAARRRPEAGPMSRLYAFEPSLTPTGAMADHRTALRPDLVRNVILHLAANLGSGGPRPDLPPDLARSVAAASQDLSAARGRAVVLVGPAQPPQVHALAHWINERLSAPVAFIAPLDPVASGHREGLAQLCEDMDGGRIGALLMLDVDPLYSASQELGFAEALQRVPFSLHAGLYRGASGRAAGWHVPLSHPLESWSDARAFDGQATIVQPLIRPLYDTRTAHHLLSAAAEPLPASDLARVQQTWREHGRADPGAWWRDTLAAGLIEDSAAEPVAPGPARLARLAPAAAPLGLVLTTPPSPQVWDGRHAPNAWLQECPDPITKEVWGASLRLNAADAERLGLRDGRAAVIMQQGREPLRAPVRIASGQAEGVVTLPLGYGLEQAGPVADGVSVNVHGRAGGLDLVPAHDGHAPPRTQGQFALEGDLAALFPTVTPDAPERPRSKPQPDLLPAKPQGEHAWAMSIDTSACIGCNACVVACQSENNIPVIGSEEMDRERDMHWLRVDRYELPDGAAGFQPVPCMQCEEAPCEPVCPVEASVHDSEGLNDQVYNRCIGTRFCQSNCPYKVRRFNFHDYADPAVYGGLDAASVQAQRNPEVTVRARGVMEKCTYCVQRISAARRASEIEDRPIADGEVQTACQAACPTQAITFGDLADPTSQISRLQHHPRRHVLLEELGTKPRTTYLARAVNPAKERAS